MYIKRPPLGEGNLRFGARRRRFPIIVLSLYLMLLCGALLALWRIDDIRPRVVAALGPPPPPTVSPLIIVEQAEASYLAGDLEEAAALYEQIILTDPENVEANLRLAHILTLTGDLDEALVVAEKMIALFPDRPEGYAAKARALNWGGDTADSAQAALQAIEIDPDYALGHAYLSEAYTDLGRLRQALEQAEMAVEMEPYNVEARRNYAYVLEHYGSYNGAIQQYLQALQLEPNRLDLLYGLARNYRGAGQIDMSVQTFQEIIIKTPSDPLPYVEMGKTYFEIRDDSAAQAYLSQAVELVCEECPLTTEVYLLRQQIADGTLSEVDFESQRTLPAELYMPAWRRLAMVYFTRRNYEDAIDLFEEAIAWAEANGEPVPIEAYYVTASAYYYLDQCEWAVPFALEALTIYEDQEIDDANALRNALSVFVLCRDFTTKPYVHAEAGFTNGYPDRHLPEPDVRLTLGIEEDEAAEDDGEE